MFDDLDSAPISEKLRATLRMLHKMTLDPADFGPDDVRPALALGVSKNAIEHAMHVAYLFNVYDRLADAMGWHVPTLESGAYQSIAKRLLGNGYL